jgi:hypothetical protein
VEAARRQGLRVRVWRRCGPCARGEDRGAAVGSNALDADEIDTLGYLARGVRGLFDVDLDVRRLANTIEWTTAHADLHWGNITGPQLYILDWESWRRAPAGYDVATLYCNSLLVPEVAARVRASAGRILDTTTGAVALLLAARRYLVLADDDAPYAPLLKPLRQLGEEQLTRLSK